MKVNSDVILVSKYAIIPNQGISSKLFETSIYMSGFFKTTLITSNSNHLAKVSTQADRFKVIKLNELTVIIIKTINYRYSKSLRRILSWFDFEFKLYSIKIDSEHPPKLILVSSLSLLTILWGLKLKRKYGTRVVFEIRDIYPLRLTHELHVSKFNPMVMIMSWIEKRGYLKSDLIVGTMPKLDFHVKNIIGVEKEVFYSPIGLSSYFKPSKGNKTIFNLPKDYSKSMIVGYSGSIGESNYLQSLIRVIKSLQNNYDYYFVIVGSGDYLERYKDDLIDCHNVLFTGRVEPSLVQDYISAVDCLYLSVKPSKIWEYGQSMNKVLDYLMAGKPIIAAYDGYPNMLNEIEGNLIIPSNDDHALIEAIKRIHSYDQTLLKDIQSSAPKLVQENYTYEIINQKYYLRIKQLMES